MKRSHRVLILAGGLTAALIFTASVPLAAPPLSLGSARVSIAGTSNIHAYTASTSDVRLTRVELDPAIAGPGFWDAIVRPGAITVFEVTVPAASLDSSKDGLDKNMHKALKVKEHPEIVFRLTRLEPRAGVPNGLSAIGTLRVAGVEREVSLALTPRPTDAGLSISGEMQLLMTDFGIAPPKAMMGMLRTDPKVTVRIDALLAVPLT